MDKTASSYVKAFLVLLFAVCILAVWHTKDYLKHVLLGTPKQPAALTVRDKAVFSRSACMLPEAVNVFTVLLVRVHSNMLIQRRYGVGYLETGLRSRSARTGHFSWSRSYGRLRGSSGSWSLS